MAAVLLLGLGLWQLGAGLWIHAKARLAQYLVAQAWAETLETGQDIKPWSWADTTPVARLMVPALNIDQIVLAGASGSTLAFGPGHLDGSAAPGTPGLSLISGHRDTHFGFLKELRPGMEIRIQRHDRRWRVYRARTGVVVDQGEAAFPIDYPRPLLALVTCYPFDSPIPGGPLRYIVMAEAK